MYSIDSQYVVSEGPTSPDPSSPGSDRLRYFRFSQPEVALDEPARSRNDVVAVYTLTGNTYNRFIESYTQLISSSVVYRFM